MTTGFTFYRFIAHELYITQCIEIIIHFCMCKISYLQGKSTYGVFLGIGENMSKVIKISCEGELLPLDLLHPFQGELKSLSKENYERLKASIIDHGLTMPICVWFNSEDEKHYILDGHQRVYTFKQMVSEGYDIYRIPIVRIMAPNYQKAKEILLTMVSQYGRIEKQGLYEFMTQNEINLDVVKQKYDLPNFDVNRFELEFFNTHHLPSINEINASDETAEWVASDMPDFEPGGDYIKLIFHFKTELERELYVKTNNIIIDKKMNNQWITHK